MPHLNVPLSNGSFQLFAVVLIFLIGVKFYLSYREAVNSIRHHPGFRSLFNTHSVIGNILPFNSLVSLGPGFGLRLKHKPYAESGWDILSLVALFPNIATHYLIADPVAVKEILSHRARFPKPVEDYACLATFGNNLIIAEGDEWKKHRRILAPGFSEKNNRLVWKESIRITSAMFESWGLDKSEVVIEHFLDSTMQIALLVIGAAGFGRHVAWDNDTYISLGHKMSFRDAMYTVSTYILLKLVAPRWAYYFSKLLRRIQLANDELRMYMQEMIVERKTLGASEGRYDLFNALLEANERDNDNDKLTDEDLIGNIFLFLIAGHETTAHTWCFMLGLLALEQDEQERLYQNILSVVPNGEIPKYEQINLLTYSLAVFYETLRLYPPAAYIPKVAAEDATIPLVKPDGSIGSMIVRKGMKLTINSPGIHYNSRYWPDPEAFRPSRFLKDWPKGAFLPFSAGSRACPGRRFAEVESVAIITMLIGRYKVEVRDPESYNSLTVLEKREKLLASRTILTTTPLHVPLVFKRR